MAKIIKLVQGDTRPVLIAVLTDETTGLPLDLTGASPVLKFKEVDADTVHATIPGTVIDALEGACAFDWAQVPGALSGEPGGYLGEIEITYSDGTIHTLFDPLRFLLREQF